MGEQLERKVQRRQVYQEIGIWTSWISLIARVEFMVIYMELSLYSRVIRVYIVDCSYNQEYAQSCAYYDGHFINMQGRMWQVVAGAIGICHESILYVLTY